MSSIDEVSVNLRRAADLIEQAADDGAALVVLPENFAVFSSDAQTKVRVREPFGSGPIQDFLAEQAMRHKLVLAGGTIPLACDEPALVRAALLVHGPDGALLGRYDKMHLFDVDASGAGEHYRESATIQPGDTLVVLDTPVGRLGLAVCYDVRFPELFRALGKLGAEILLLPSAFTATTGAAHWELLVRARAVENLCFIVAPDQGARAESSRKTWGHSMAVGPWGEILASLGQAGEGIALADTDLGQLAPLRGRFPALTHRRI